MGGQVGERVRYVCVRCVYAANSAHGTTLHRCGSQMDASYGARVVGNVTDMCKCVCARVCDGVCVMVCV